ncbi:MAG: hypothetical protein Q8P95_04325 [bacterium]|nr:hypothetical protein [bacterium]
MPYQNATSQLFLSIENEVGTTRLERMVLTSLAAAIHDFREKGEEDFLEQFYELLEMVKNTEPRIALVIDRFYHIWTVLCEAKNSKHPETHLYWERQILEALDRFHKESKEERKAITRVGVELVKEGDVILIHSISTTVLDVLLASKRAGKKFRVIVAEQELEKTSHLIEVLTSNKIHFQVVPEYMLSHIEEEVTKVLLGGVTINNTLHVVCDAGTNAIVSEFHLSKTAVYLFISTRKFSLWETRSQQHHYKVSTTRLRSCKEIEFERIKFSHDRVSLSLYDKVVTEKGVMTIGEITQLYKEKFNERASWREEFFKD